MDQCPACGPRACCSDSCVKNAQEKEVSTLAQTAAARWKTEADGVAAVTENVKPKVLVLDGYHESDPGYSDGWYVQTCRKTDVCPRDASGRCPGERWCHMIRSAGGDPFNADLKITTTNANFGYEDGSLMGITHKELQIWAKDVDIVIMKHGNMSAADMQTLLSAIGGIKAVGNKRVYDTLRILDNSGRPTYLGHAQIEPNVLLQDLIMIANDVLSANGDRPKYNHSLVFFRNLQTETMGNGKRCLDETNAALKLNRVGCKPIANELLAGCNDHFATSNILYWCLHEHDCIIRACPLIA